MSRCLLRCPFGTAQKLMQLKASGFEISEEDPLIHAVIKVGDANAVAIKLVGTTLFRSKLQEHYPGQFEEYRRCTEQPFPLMLLLYRLLLWALHFNSFWSCERIRYGFNALLLCEYRSCAQCWCRNQSSVTIPSLVCHNSSRNRTSPRPPHLYHFFSSSEWIVCLNC